MRSIDKGQVGRPRTIATPSMWSDRILHGHFCSILGALRLAWGRNTDLFTVQAPQCRAQCTALSRVPWTTHPSIPTTPRARPVRRHRRVLVVEDRHGGRDFEEKTRRPRDRSVEWGKP
ncbi:hypothetical protein NL676_002883 [Syzygium grande]|nr:hypothetical protein NL676_002883 [Syzygium grande]